MLLTCSNLLMPDMLRFQRHSFVKLRKDALVDDGVNTKIWYGHGSSFASKERRILITHIYWIGEAYEKLTSVKYDHLRLRVWEKTGCMITADESDDQLINPEGLKNYVVPPPAYFIPSAWLPQFKKKNLFQEQSTWSQRKKLIQRILVGSCACPTQTNIRDSLKDDAGSPTLRPVANGDGSSRSVTSLAIHYGSGMSDNPHNRGL